VSCFTSDENQDLAALRLRGDARSQDHVQACKRGRSWKLRSLHKGTVLRSRSVGPGANLLESHPRVPECAAGAGEQHFAADLRGCAGTVTFADRASLCADGWSVCTAADWVERHGAEAPTANHWTDDELRYGGTASASCWVHETSGQLCPLEAPMRVCAGTADGLGNSCNWIDCGYQSAPPPNHFFGGCLNNLTAGTLCCR
jgi:hypothetical protein